jgi:tetratricopeptide (TPR) repeat protein
MNEKEQQLTFKSLFLPFTTKKAVICIVIIGFIVFFNALFSGFIWDDNLYVISGSASIGSHLLRLFTGFSIFNSTGFYRPIAAIYYFLLYNLFGVQPFFYHFSQIIFHIFNSVLLFVFLSKFFSKKISFILSLIFLVHPMQVETATYISSYGSLSFFFSMIALLLSVAKRQNWKTIALIICFLFLSLLTKEAGVVFLVLIPLLRYLLKKGNVLLYGVLSMATLSAYIGLRFISGGIYVNNNLIAVPIAQLSLFMRLFNIPEIIFYYLKTFIFPVNLAIAQYWVVTKITIMNFYFPLLMEFLLAILFIIIGIIYSKNKKYFPLFVFFSVWFILGMSINLQIIPLDGTVADRWFYIPMIGLLGLVGVIWQSISIYYVKLQKIISIVLIIVIVLFSVRTIIRNQDWQNPITLYAHDIAVVDSYQTESMLGNELWYENKLDEALIHFKRSEELRPGFDYIASEIATIYERKDDIQQAKKYHFKAMAEKNFTSAYKHSYIVYLNISRFLCYFDSPSVAKKYVTQGLAEYPKEKYLWILLALDEYKMKNKLAALSALKQADASYPDQNVRYLYLQISMDKPITVPIQAFWPREDY